MQPRWRFTALPHANGSMNLDGITLVATGSFIAGLAAVLLFGAWSQMRGAGALLWWSGAYFANALGVGALAVAFSTHAPAAFAGGTGLITTTAVLVWAGVRRFNRRSVPPLLLAATLLVWLGAGRLPADPGVAARVATFALTATFLAASIFELWRGRRERLTARWPLMAVLAIHAAMFTGGIVDLLAGNLPSAVQVPTLGSFFGLIMLEQMVFVVGSAIFMVVLCRERVELGYKNAARVDSLTGVANRGAFFERADRLIRRCHADSVPCSLIVFDLDHFKRVNDTLGHRAGDGVLRRFADAARAVLRPNDLFGRHGGEEFAVVLPGTTAEVASVIAERIRHSFAEPTTGPDETVLRATVSAGVAAAEPGAGVEATMEAADRALYRAKQLGRNRVERAESGVDDRKSNVIRVA